MADSIYLEKTAVSTARIWRLSVEQYHEMIRTGILTEDDRIELLEGLLVAKMTKGPAHITLADLARELLGRILPDGWFARNEQPITTADSEPEPDVAVIRGNRRDYLHLHPSPQDVALVIEVSDSSLKYDQTTKKKIYARAGIPAYWILNLIDNRLEAYTDPTDDPTTPDYLQSRYYSASESIPVFIEGHQIGQVFVKDLLP